MYLKRGGTVIANASRFNCIRDLVFSDLSFASDRNRGTTDGRGQKNGIPVPNNTRFAWAGKCLEDMHTVQVGFPTRGGPTYVSCMYKMNNNTPYNTLL